MKMRIPLSACWLVACCLLALAGVIGLAVRGAPAAESQPGCRTTFATEGATCTVRLVFRSPLPAADLLEICFEFKHLKEFYHESEVRLLKKGADWQTVEYRTDYTVGTSTATYRKTIDRARHTVGFTMLDNKVSGWGIPVMTALSGSYAISASGDLRTITYEQSVTMDKEIGVLEWTMIQRKTNAFFADFEAYVRLQEARRPKTSQPPKKGNPP